MGHIRTLLQLYAPWKITVTQGHVLLYLSVSLAVSQQLVIGALLGIQTGREVEIFNSYELQFALQTEGGIRINEEYFLTKQEQCKDFLVERPTSSGQLFFFFFPPVSLDH